MKKSLSKLERVPLREAWKHEANDFTPWLAQEENLNALSEALSLGELELVAKEHWVGEFKLDILCACGDEQVISMLGEHTSNVEGDVSVADDSGRCGGQRPRARNIGVTVEPAHEVGGAVAAF